MTRFANAWGVAERRSRWPLRPDEYAYDASASRLRSNSRLPACGHASISEVAVGVVTSGRRSAAR